MIFRQKAGSFTNVAFCIASSEEEDPAERNQMITPARILADSNEANSS
jgi:hypothetical protein